MKTKIIRAYLMITALVLIVSLGCASFQSNAGKTIASVAITVDIGMKFWAKWVNTQGATPEQELMVRNAYMKYQIAMKTAKIAYADLAVDGNKVTWSIVEKTLVDTSDSIVQLISAFSKTNQVKITP